MIKNVPIDLAQRVETFTAPTTDRNQAQRIACESAQHYQDHYPEIANTWEMIEQTLYDPTCVDDSNGADWLSKIEEPFGSHAALKTYMLHLKAFERHDLRSNVVTYLMKDADFIALC